MKSYIIHKHKHPEIHKKTKSSQSIYTSYNWIQDNTDNHRNYRPQSTSSKVRIYKLL